MRRRRLPVLAPVVFVRRVQRQVRRRNPDEDEGVLPERRDGGTPVRRTERRVPELQRTGILILLLVLLFIDFFGFICFIWNRYFDCLLIEQFVDCNIFQNLISL